MSEKISNLKTKTIENKKTFLFVLYICRVLYGISLRKKNTLFFSYTAHLCIENCKYGDINWVLNLVF